MRIRIFSAPLFLLSIIGSTVLCDEHTQLLSEEYGIIAHHFEQIGNREKAFEYYTKLLNLHYNDPHVLVKLGTLSYEQNNIPDAISYYERALQQRHSDSHMHFNLGICYQQHNEWSKAAEQFQQTIELDPTHVRAHLYGAAAYEKLHHYDHAFKLLNQATQLDENSFDIWHQLANLYRHTEQLESAVVPYRNALSQQPNNAHIMMDLANTLNMLNRNEESLELYEKIVEQNQDAISALYNFGFTLKKMDKLKEAQKIYQRVLAKKPDYAPAHFSLASIYLSLGLLTEGWEEYEWRWKAYNEKAERGNIPVWNGEALSSKTLFIYAEQGLGDTLQFIRYLKTVKDTYPDCRIIFETQSPLVPLFKSYSFIDQLVKRNEPIPPADYQVALMSLPRIFKTNLETIPADIPYIEPDAERLAFWKEKLASDNNFKIGICWQGNARYRTQALRRAVAAKSLPLQAFKPLAALPGISLYSLQQVDGLEQVDTCDFKDKLIIFDESFDKQYGAFMDTAAVMQHLDLVISVDTGVCHLAGAMGLPTYILLPFPGDWRWLRNRSDSPWYPSVELFRQTSLHDWETPMQEIVMKITKHLKGSHIQKPSLLQDDGYLPTPEQHNFFEELLRKQQS